MPAPNPTAPPPLRLLERSRRRRGAAAPPPTLTLTLPSWWQRWLGRALPLR